MAGLITGRGALLGALWVASLLAVGGCKREQATSASAGVYRFGPQPKASPRRIVSLAPNMTEVLFALGVGKRVVGVTRFCDYPAAARGRPKIGGFLDPSLEAVIALRPDLAVGVPNSNNRRVVERLGSLRIPVLLVEAHSLADVYRLLRVVGAAVGRRAAARELETSMRTRATRVRTRVRGVPRTRVLFAYGREPLVVAGPGSFADELLRLAGAVNVVHQGTARYPTWPLERVLAAQPEVIVESTGMGSAAAPSPAVLRARWSRYRSLPAVRSGRIYWIDPQVVARPGPRLVAGLERLARLLYPKRFEGR